MFKLNDRIPHTSQTFVREDNNGYFKQPDLCQHLKCGHQLILVVIGNKVQSAKTMLLIDIRLSIECIEI